MKPPQPQFQRTRLVLAFFALVLAIPFVARVLLIATRWADMDASVSLGRLLWVGLRLDAVTGGALATLVALAVLVLPRSPSSRTLLVWGTTMALACIAAAEIAGWFFFQYYDARPNYLVLEHGADPEVASAMLKAYPVVRIGLFVLACGALFHWVMIRVITSSEWDGLKDRLGVLATMLVAAFCVRGTLDHRPLNPSFAAFSSHRLANEIAGNGVFNVVYELLQQSGETYGSVSEVVGDMGAQEAFSLAREHLKSTGSFVETTNNPLARRVGETAGKKLNVVVVVMESFTARLGGAWGGELSLTPECDKWASKGLLLENCLATGERTVQGLEAVLCSFPPLPGSSVIRRPQARDGGFTTLGSLLKKRGYATAFYYGGQGIFDHMKGFFIANGFDRFVEEDNFKDVTYKGSWGVCDEDVFRQADRDFEALYKEGKPFFASILTVSLHSPWEFPSGKAPLTAPGTVPLPGFDPPELDNFLYADWAVGRFLETASRKEYFKDTVFVFVGDHGVHLRGRDLVPLSEYRVVSFIIGPGLEGLRVSKPVSQLDLAPTVLGLLGGSWETPFFGRDILKETSTEPWALMIYKKRRYGVLEGGRYMVLSEGGDTQCSLDSRLVLTPTDKSPEGEASLRRGMGVVRAAEELMLTKCYRAD